MTKRLCVLLFLIAGAVYAQNPRQVPAERQCIQFGNCYTIYKETSLSSSAEAITVQAGAILNIQPIAASVYCSGAADVTLRQNGTAATTTALTVTALNAAPPAQATAYSASNVGTGNLVDKVSIPSGGGTFQWDLTGLIAYASSNGSQNITISTSSVTATCRIKFWVIEGNF
jgi:hypothetical protein